MAPLKFEEHIKEKMEQRTLQPSNDAWQKLDEQLNSDSSRKNNKGFWWLGIAASLIGVLLVVTFMMTSENSEIVPEIIVDTENGLPQKTDHVISESDDSEDKTPVTQQEDTNAEDAHNSIEKAPKTKPSLLERKIIKEQTKLVPTRTEDAVAHTEQKEDIEVKQDEQKDMIKSLTFEEQQIQTVVAKMQELQKEDTSALDSELDALLNEAQKEIALEKLYNEAMQSIDAEALLQGIEQDLDQSFRNKVFEALKASYKTVKTAVAERNN